MDVGILGRDWVELVVDIEVWSEIFSAFAFGRVYIIEGKSSSGPINLCLHMAVIKVKEIINALTIIPYRNNTFSDHSRRDDEPSFGEDESSQGEDEDDECSWEDDECSWEDEQCSEWGCWWACWWACWGGLSCFLRQTKVMQL